METLQEMEQIEVDNKDRPIEDIIIIKAQVFVDPYVEADEQLQKERAEEAEKAKKEEELRKRKMEAMKTLKPFHDGIGKYINPALTSKR